MRKFFVLGLTLIGLAGGAPADARTRDADQREIAAVEEQWRAARIAGDTSFLDNFYAKECRIQGMTGEVQSRDADIALFATGKIKPKFIVHGPLDISTYGKTAVVTGVDHLGGTAFGHYGDMFLRFTDVLVKREGRWQLIVQQTTPTRGF